MTYERVQENYKLVLGSPDFISSIVPNESEIRTNKEYKKRGAFQDQVWKEYLGIRDLLYQLLGTDSMAIIKSRFGIGMSRIHPEIEYVKAPELSEHYRSWLRDSFVSVSGQVLLNPQAWRSNEENHFTLGEGGAVLVRNKVALFSEAIVHAREHELDKLRKRGIKVGILPGVEKPKKKFENPFIEWHADGHSALIETGKGNLALLVSKYYYRYGNCGRNLRDLNGIAGIAGFEIVEFKANELPTLALNLVQFDDLSIAMTSGAPAIEARLRELVGDDKVFTTAVPLRLIPKYAFGGIRCLTNILPTSLLQ